MTSIYGYQNAHERHRRARGMASGYLCIACGGTADEWAYNHSDPNEVTDPQGRVYSDDASFYDPMCVPCHRRTDRYRKVTRCPKGHEYSGDNLIIEKSGNRRCRECRNAYQRNLRANFTEEQRHEELLRSRRKHARLKELRRSA